MKKNITLILLLAFIFIFAAQSVALASDGELTESPALELTPEDIAPPPPPDEPEAEEAATDYINIAQPLYDYLQGEPVPLHFQFYPNTWSGWYWSRADFFVTDFSVTDTSNWQIAQLLNIGINKEISGFTPIPGNETASEWRSTLDTTNLPPGDYKIWVAVTANVWTSFYQTRRLRILPNPGIVPVSGVTLNRSSYTMDIGKKMQLSATLSPSNATNKTVTWKSSNTAVATVDSYGKVTAKKQGSATITATSVNGKSAKCAVTVRKPATAIKLDKTSVSVAKGSTVQLKVASFSPSTTYPKTITWKTNDAKIATVDSSGKVKGVAKGTAYIYAKTWNGVFAKCKVTVK